MINISQASINELDNVVLLFDLYRQFYNQPSNLTEAKKFLEEKFINQQSIIFIAKDNHQVACGFIQLYPIFSSVSMKKLWLLNDMYVAKEFRNQKIGYLLLTQAKQFAQQTNSKGLMLQTGHANTTAQKLYEKFGFIKDDDYVYNCFL